MPSLDDLTTLWVQDVADQDVSTINSSESELCLSSMTHLPEYQHASLVSPEDIFQTTRDDSHLRGSSPHHGVEVGVVTLCCK